jgi:glutamate-5-semialdehyde dehydrogenase
MAADRPVTWAPAVPGTAGDVAAPARQGAQLEADDAVAAAGLAARQAAAELRRMPAARLDDVLRQIAAKLAERAPAVLDANARDVHAAKHAGMAEAFVDRLALDEARLGAMASQLRALAEVPAEADSTPIRELPGGLELRERRLPVGVIGANFEARPNVVTDIASQLIKSRNGGVLRTGSAAIGSASVLMDDVIGPAMAAAGMNPAAIQLVRVPGHASAAALVRQPRLIPLVILRGSGDSTRALAREAALHGVRTLAHADGGAVIYLDESADQALALLLVEQSLDRLGVCNRLNLLLIHPAIWDTILPRLAALTARLGISLSLPPAESQLAESLGLTTGREPHAYPLGHEWALDPGAEATITVARAATAQQAAAIANAETSGLAASVVAANAAAATTFLDSYAGTGAFWNATPRLLDGFKLLSVPETGINIDVVPGPRGPVTFRDLHLRQYLVVPSAG